jgi:hypothetical protein
MRFMMMVKSNGQSEAGVLPSEAELSAMGVYNDELIAAKVMLAGEGLQASSKGTRVRINGNKTQIIDGPFSETKELLAGYWLIQTQTKQEAIEWAKKVPFEEGEVEVRQIYELADFGIEIPETITNAPPTPARKPGTKRYAVLIKADAKTEAAVMPSEGETLFEEMGALMNDYTQKGAVLAGDGLQPTSRCFKVKYDGKQRSVIDGPFTETKEIIAGFSIVQFATKEEAVEFARQQLAIHCKWSQLPGEIEVREIFEIEDFPVSPEEKPDGWRDRETRFRDAMSH